MHHIKPLGKGDPLCPLGFHPQVRWPTRCKRCFRDYKEHGNRNKDNDASLRRDETTLSTPSLSSWTSRNRDDKGSDSGVGSRTWTSSSNLSSTASSNNYKSTTEDTGSSRFGKTASSWTSSPNLVNLREDTQAKDTIPTVNITLQKRRTVTSLDSSQDEDDYRRTAYTVRRRTAPSLPPSSSFRDTTPTRDRVRTSPVSTVTVTKTVDLPKMSGKPPVAPRSTTTNRIQLTTKAAPPSSSSSSSSESSEEDTSDEDDKASIANTETTDTTLVNDNELLQDQVDSLKRELEVMKARCEKVEKEKSEILLRRLASLDTVPAKTSSSEVLKLQQRVNELQSTVEDLRDDKKSLNLKVMELEADLEKIKEIDVLKKEAENLRSKLQAAESLCEELMDENEDMKKELRDLEDEMDEMQDNFREEQADEYSSLKKELEQTAKNCRILSFKLRKSERKAEQMEADKLEAEKKYREVVGGQAGLDKTERIRSLEQQLTVANEVSQRLQKELEEANAKLNSAKSSDDKTAVKKKAPMLGAIGKSASGEKVSRESLTRGGSQEDPVQLLRDLQDSMEREADLREQLRYAEEEAQNLRKKASRVEDDNESLVLQLKKMATKARTHRSSPTPSRLTPEPPVEKDEGISDEEDPAELRLLLELNEQEAAVLRRKVEELEGEGHNLKKKVKELQDKLTAKTATANRRAQIHGTEPKESNAIYEQKIKVLEEEMNDLRKKLVEKERDCERLHAELSLAQKKPKVLQKAKSLDGDQQTLDLKRQLQVVEQEASVLRARNQTLESDNEKLTAENKKLTLTQVTKKTAQERAASLDMKLKLSELEKKLEEANKQLEEKCSKEEKLSPVVKKPTAPIGSAEIERIKAQLTKAEAENKKLNDTLQRLKDEAASNIIEFYQKRTPKKPTDITTKLQMKKMVTDLESEIGEMLVALKKSELERKKATENNKNVGEVEKLHAEITGLKKTLETTQNELKDEKAKLEKEKEKSEKDIKAKEDAAKKQVDVEKEKNLKKLEEEKKKLEESYKKLEKSNASLEAEIERVKKELGTARSAQDEVRLLNQKMENLKTSLREQKDENETLSKQIETVKKSEQELTKVNKEVSEKSKKLLDAEKKLMESEEKLKKSQSLVNSKKEKITKLEKELESSKEVRKKDMDDWVTEKAKLVEQLEELKSKNKELDEQLNKKKELVSKLEKSVQEEREKATDMNVKAGTAAAKEISQLKEELATAQTNAQKTIKKLSSLEDEKKVSDKSNKETIDKLQKEIKEWETKVSDLEMDLSAERKLAERLKTTHEQAMKNKDEELTKLKSKAQIVGGKKAADIKEYQANIEKLELALKSEKREYDELTAKYELLEEEHVVTKSKLVMDRENVQGQLVASQRELVSVEAELRALRETYNSKQDAWIKEKLDLQEKMKELEDKTSKINGASDTWQLEKMRLIAISDEKSSQIDQLRKDNQAQLEQIDHMRKEIEDYRQQLDDYTKVNKIQRSMTADSSALDKEIRDLKNRLFMEERGRKSEVAEQKMRYEKRVSVITDELQNLQGQVARFKRERDTFRHMLEGTQKTIAELKAVGHPTKAAGQGSDEVEELKNQVSSLEQQISCMEDELSEARLESSQLKTELVSERSSWEIKLSELTSKLNEMEEDRLLNSGRTRVVGLKSKIELAWQKEREDQQRLLQETSTLARDLRQTLFEVERERDKERLETKRKHDQLKKAMEEEQEENRKKIHEMQCDLLELRDAHAKLRTTNEKLRREKDRIDKERETLKLSSTSRRRVEQEENHRVTAILQLVDDLMVLAPDLFPTKPGGTSLAFPTPPARRKGKSRESSPITERSSSKEPSPAIPDKSQQLQAILQRLTEATDELRRGQRARTEDREKARPFLSINRRAGSTESEHPLDSASNSLGLKKNPSLYRKSLSLEQTSVPPSGQNQIWKESTDGSLNSIQSLDESIDTKFHSLQRRDPSLDSRLSGGSTQSEVIPSTADKKKKKSLFGKLKKLTKTRSVDEDSDYELHSSSQYDRGSDTSLGSAAATDTETSRTSKQNLKGRFTGMFKKSGSTSRGNSLERNVKPPTGSTMSGLPDSSDTSLQRSQARSTSNLRTSPSPARSDVGPSSSVSRPLGSSSTTTASTTISIPHKVPPNSAPLQRRVIKK